MEIVVIIIGVILAIPFGMCVVAAGVMKSNSTVDNGAARVDFEAEEPKVISSLSGKQNLNLNKSSHKEFSITESISKKINSN